MDERMTRLRAGADADAIGYGGLAAVGAVDNRSYRQRSQYAATKLLQTTATIAFSLVAGRVVACGAPIVGVAVKTMRTLANGELTGEQKAVAIASDLAWTGAIECHISPPLGAAVFALSVLKAIFD